MLSLLDCNNSNLSEQVWRRNGVPKARTSTCTSALKRSLMPSILHTLRQWHSIQSTRKTQLLNETQSVSKRTIIVGTNISVITVSEFSCMHIAIMWPWSSWMHKNVWLTTMRSMLTVQLMYCGCGWQVWPCRGPQCDAALQRGVNRDSWSAIDSVDCLHSVPPASDTVGAGISINQRTEHTQRYM